jgi:hypothetical protein
MEHLAVGIAIRLAVRVALCEWKQPCGDDKDEASDMASTAPTWRGWDDLCRLAGGRSPD